MPGFVLHLVAAQMLLNKVQNRIEEKYFLWGNLLPDATMNKSISHFWKTDDYNTLIRTPQLDVFFNKYRFKLHNSSILGYFYHLYIDWKFFKEYLPQRVSFLDLKGQETTEKENVCWARIKHTGEQITIKDFYSEKYYYGDYTRMNHYLVERYQVSLDYDVSVGEFEIDEIDCCNVCEISQQLNNYLRKSEEGIEALKVFEIHDLLQMLENATDEFMERYLLDNMNFRMPRGK